MADRVGMPPALEGQGILRLLPDRFLADAAAAGFSIVRLCPYVNPQRRRHPEWASVRCVTRRIGSAVDPTDCSP